MYRARVRVRSESWAVTRTRTKARRYGGAERAWDVRAEWPILFSCEYCSVRYVMKKTILMNDSGKEGRKAGEGDITAEEHELWLAISLTLVQEGLQSAGVPRLSSIFGLSTPHEFRPNRALLYGQWCSSRHLSPL